MDWAGWALFGFIATLALTSIMVAAQLTGRSRMDLPLMLGAMFVEDPDKARVVGVGVHLVNGQAFALLYAAAFALLGFASWWLGLLFGIFHGVVALTLIMPLLPALHPRMASERSGTSLAHTLEPPGLFGLNYGTQTAAFALIGHAVYGLLLGMLLQPR